MRSPPHPVGLYISTRRRLKSASPTTPSQASQTMQGHSSRLPSLPIMGSRRSPRTLKTLPPRSGSAWHCISPGGTNANGKQGRFLGRTACGGGRSIVCGVETFYSLATKETGSGPWPNRFPSCPIYVGCILTGAPAHEGLHNVPVGLRPARCSC